MNILDEKNIDPKDSRFRPILKQLQGNILKGHGRDHTVHLFFRFTGNDARRNQKLIRDLARFVTSVAQQLEDRDRVQENGPKDLPFGNLFLTAKGYRSLGYSAEQLVRAFQESRASPPLDSQVEFLKGMGYHYKDLGDPPLITWETGYVDPRAKLDRAQLLDGMMLLANDDLKLLQTRERDIRRRMNGWAEVLVTERGLALFNKDKSQNLEHFGYVDGRSQPTFFQADHDSETTKKDGTKNWDPSAPLNLVLIPDPLAPSNRKRISYGSYFVFRKLEQNVKQFKMEEGRLAQKLGLEGEAEELAGALAVGRFEDGTPVLYRPHEGLAVPVPNDFTFRDDRQGLRCPFHAHIRKVNPREHRERGHRIVRRGITYGFRSVEPKDEPESDSLPTGGVGLLFMCFQASIDNQFAYMQRKFANDTKFPHRNTGLDPIIGQADAGQSRSQSWRSKWGRKGLTKRLDFSGFVKLLGGDFFFAPSIAFLQRPAPPRRQPSSPKVRAHRRIRRPG